MVRGDRECGNGEIGAMGRIFENVAGSSSWEPPPDTGLSVIVLNFVTLLQRHPGHVCSPLRNKEQGPRAQSSIARNYNI